MATSSEGSRHDFSESTKQLLARRAGFRCSICDESTIGPHSEENKTVYLGEAAHIHAAGEKGPRANPTLSKEERSAASNGIHLCKQHAKLVDVDVPAYPAERLRQLKIAHEQKIRSIFTGPSVDYDPDFLNSHETQILHGRGSPALSNLWIPRHLSQTGANNVSTRKAATELLQTETGTILIMGEQSSGRTSVLKRLAANALANRNCVWIDGRKLTESNFKNPAPFLAASYAKINSTADGWSAFLDAPTNENIIFVDDLHLAPINIASRRKFLCMLQGMADLIVATISPAFLIELLSVASKDSLLLNGWLLADLTRADCHQLADSWCRFGAESVADHELDIQVAFAQEQVELLFGKKLMPRQPLFLLAALQMIDAKSPIDTAVGSFGGVYESVIHLAISKHAKSQGDISNEHAYLEELAYWCENRRDGENRNDFNRWFAERKGVHKSRVDQIESSLSLKGFLSSKHQGFRFNYQRYYFQACFIRANPNRDGVQDYISKLINRCWDEDYANTALFLAYLQPSSSLIQGLLGEIDRIFNDRVEFDISQWKVDTSFPKDFFRDLPHSVDPESNRKLLAHRLDETDPVDSPECAHTPAHVDHTEMDPELLDFIKGFHLIKLVGQLMRNSPIALDATQKEMLVRSTISLSLRIVTFMGEILSLSTLQTQALNQVRAGALKKTERIELEAKLTGILYNLSVFMVFSVFRHTTYHLAHPDLSLIYDKVLDLESKSSGTLTHRAIGCGIHFDLRSPSSDFLHKVYKDLGPAGKDLLRMWTWIFLSFNRVTASRRQAIIESVDMGKNVQLLLPRE